MANLEYPLQFDGRGRTGTTDREAHIRELIEQVLFTAPGERVNRPDFGSGLMQLVFAPNSDTLAAATELLMRGSLQHWLGDLIEVEELEVSNQDATLSVRLQYLIRSNGARQTAEFTRGGGL